MLEELETAATIIDNKVYYCYDENNDIPLALLEKKLNGIYINSDNYKITGDNKKGVFMLLKDGIQYVLQISGIRIYFIEYATKRMVYNFIMLKEKTPGPMIINATTFEEQSYMSLRFPKSLISLKPGERIFLSENPVIIKDIKLYGYRIELSYLFEGQNAPEDYTISIYHHLNSDPTYIKIHENNTILIVKEFK